MVCDFFIFQARQTDRQTRAQTNNVQKLETMYRFFAEGNVGARPDEIYVSNGNKPEWLATLYIPTAMDARTNAQCPEARKIAFCCFLKISTTSGRCHAERHLSDKIWTHLIGHDLFGVV